MIIDVVRRMKMKLKKARMLISDKQQSCSRHRQLTVEANKQTRLALNDVCTQHLTCLTVSHWFKFVRFYSGLLLAVAMA